jgi:hypothetical protein
MNKGSKEGKKKRRMIKTHILYELEWGVNKVAKRNATKWKHREKKKRSETNFFLLYFALF